MMMQVAQRSRDEAEYGQQQPYDGSNGQKQSSQNSNDKGEDSMGDEGAPQTNPEADALSQDKPDLRVETGEPSGLDNLDMDMGPDSQLRSKVSYNGLSPITRKSERERKNIRYD